MKIQLNLKKITQSFNTLNDQIIIMIYVNPNGDIIIL